MQFVIGQRHINIRRNAIGPKSGQVQKVGRRIAENFNLKGLHRLDINYYLYTFFFIWCDQCYYFLCSYNFIRSLVAL